MHCSIPGVGLALVRRVGPLASALARTRNRGKPAVGAARVPARRSANPEEEWPCAHIKRSGFALAWALGAGAASADVKIAFIDPLSGGAAATGILAQKTHQFYIDAINAAGGINGEKIELMSFDNKVNPQESLIQLKKALDEGARYVVQGNGSSVALAITDAVQKHNERNPGKEVLFLNYAAVDPALTNEKCNFWHFRFDADADMKMAAMTDVIAQGQEDQEAST